MKYFGSTSLMAIAAFAAFPAHAQDVVGDTDGADVSDESIVADQVGDVIIVTGTRQSGLTAADSAAPIKLVDAESLQHVGQPNLNQALTQLIPSFRAQGFGGDTANLTLTASLRGLNPNHTLVLVNGKRRHGTANLQVRASPSQGGAAPDLDFISPGSISRIEVLEDGAAAQYGSDAIAGVINIILKNQEGGSLTATGGEHYTGGGRTLSGSINYGWQTDRGYLNMTAFYRDNESTRRGAQDLRGAGLDGEVASYLSGALRDDILAADNYPNLTAAYGRADSSLVGGSFNAGVDLSDAIELYSFGTIAYRDAKTAAYYRAPNRVVASASGTDTGGVSVDEYNNIVATDPSRIFLRNGFAPKLAIEEADHAITAGLRGDTGEWTWDISTTYGRDKIKNYTLNSANANLFAEQGSRQRDFYVGSLRFSEWTNNIDVTRDIASFATLAFGGEYRENRYAIGAGEPSSYYKTGAQSFPGFSPVSAGSFGRHSYAVYGDVALTAVENLLIDAAIRYEDFSDFGDTTNFRLTGRYDFSPAFAIRGTAATGFRAPTLAEQYYSQVVVGPTSALVQLSPNSDAAKAIGIEDLAPEKSTSFSIGTVLRPTSALTVTLDAYQIELRDRIVGSATFSPSTPGFDPSDPIWQAIGLSGFGIDTTGFVGVTSFVNGPTTRTRGVDLTASYRADLGDMGRADFTLSGAYNRTKITKDSPTPATLANLGVTLSDAQSNSFITTASPELKLIAGVNWTWGDFSLTARETYYSKSEAVLNASGNLVDTSVGAAAITDLELGYQLAPNIGLFVGAQNLFDKMTDTVKVESFGGLSDGGAVVDAPLTYGPYGIEGGYYYARFKIDL